jgi:AraC-like DNA-binding protein
MRETLRGVTPARLERSCRPPRDGIRLGARADGVEFAEARLSSWAFEPHRHDTYAIGVTVAGVQSFRYRGERRICLPGQIHVLHPDEVHDGTPATPDGFRYRIVYVAPELVRHALGGDALPFVAEPVQSQTHRAPCTRALAALLADIDGPIGDLKRVEIVAIVADALRDLAGGTRRPSAVDLTALERGRDYLAAHPDEQTPASTLERLAGLDRFSIARQFRQAFGTSPDRYRSMRRLERARAAIEAGATLARAAADAGFADQSHMTRQFKRAYGMTPGAYVTRSSVDSAGPAASVW